MEYTLNFYDDTFRKKGLYKVYPELKNEILHYKKIWNRQLQNSSALELFEIPINAGFPNEEYIIRWDIDKVLSYLQRNKINHRSIRIADKNIWSCDVRLNRNKLSYLMTTPKISDPIVIARYPSINKDIVIDGNHRYHVARLKNNNYIDAYILDPSIHLKFMSESNRISFIIHHNMFVLHSYIHFPFIRKPQIGRDFSNDSIYTIKTDTCIFSKRRRIVFLLLRVFDTIKSSLIRA